MDQPTALFDRYRRHGDLDALGQAFDQLSPRLLALALHLTGNAADAEDTLQATFVIAMQKASRFDARQPIAPWLAGVLAGEANNLRRREQRRRTEVLEEATVADVGAAGVMAGSTTGADDGGVVAAAERREVVAQLRTRIEALPEEQRQVLLLQLQHGLQPAEIAEVLGVAPGTVRMRLHRGLDALRRVLPTALLPMLIVGTSRRGLAAVRESVLQAGVTHAAVAGAAGSSMLVTGQVVSGAMASGAMAGGAMAGVMMKKVLLAAAGIAAGLLLWRLVVTPSQVVDHSARDHATLAANGVIVSHAPPDADLAHREAAVAAATELTREPVVATPGELQVTVRGYGPIDDDPYAMEVMQPEPGSGVLLPGVVVEVWPAHRERRRDRTRYPLRCSADRDGTCAFADLAPGVWRAAIDGGGILAEAHEEVLPGQRSTVELFAELRGTLRGRVVDADGRPVVGAELWVGGRLDSFTAPENLLRHACSSGVEGRFVVPFLRQEQFVNARLAGHGASRAHPLQQLGDGEVVLVLGRESCSVAGLVVDDLGAPIAHAVVSIDALDGDLRRDADGNLVGPRLGAFTRSDQHGAFAFDGLAAGSFSVTAQHMPNGTVNQRLRIVAGDRAQLRMELPRRAVVVGRVLRPDGGPCRNVYVSLSYNDAGSHTDLTDDDGQFCFEGVSIKPFELIAKRIGSERDTRRAMPVPPPAPAVIEVDLTYDELPQLSGRLRAEQGMPLTSWYVTLGDGAAARSEVSDETGTFRICDVAAGMHTLRVHRLAEDAANPVLTAQLTTGVHAQLLVPADAMPFAEVRGRIVDADGRPIEQAMVALPYAGVREGSPPGDSTFRFAQLLPGDHWLRIEAPGHVVWHRAITLAERERKDLGDIVMVPAATLRVRFLRPDGKPWRAHPPTPWLQGRPGQFLSTPNDVKYSVDGEEVVASGIAPGTYSIHGSSGDELRMPPIRVTLVAGDQQRVTIPVAIGRHRELVFADLDAVLGEPPELHVTVRGADDVGVFDGSVRVDDGCAMLKVIAPLGTVTVEARSAGRIVAKRTFVVGPDLNDEPRIEVPRVD